ncbi:MAG TPA: hypothetical protein VMM57_03645 [Bacteroidota bacterium]|nr:hypothetical protein [Bacteroidota bacterium]
MEIDDQQALSQFLQPGESLQWTGRPVTGLVLRKSDAMMIPFSLLWGGFALFWEYMAYSQGAPSFFLLFGGAFLLVALYIVVGRFFYDMVRRSHTVYGLTGERALILSGVLGRSLKAFNLKSTPEVSVQLRADGRGTIVFGSFSGIQTLMINTSWPGSSQSSLPAFELVDNASHVYQMIQSAQRKG